MVEENKRKATFLNVAQAEYEVTQIDDCLITSGARCDKLVTDFTRLIELMVFWENVSVLDGLAKSMPKIALDETVDVFEGQVRHTGQPKQKCVQSIA
ncbi:hypothetical protein [Mesorhizobium sp.]|uniref:hypothetical protein n=1 Tax=Mesorhizobium sp. TaxID=1871066 RepID=UPI000FE4E15D|nr:hypothetical protein [Mesorhizobium sp.]RWK34273.1 MAG: hypothetical protein EOR46_28770 [Mesorhizobium sp.]RWK66321.1 MAG: hypothetical protein EOR54_24810 [Mesorhizobium sp.]RWK72601.1 MAG: hypothetical protein EOR50_27945 [Mesorhizobium sp.]RWK80787.1 MAG: hypothetical protein EOR51_17165 [Mesorhizobium sp.]RWL08053.1 MAG: hypothetical protein EOR55_05545 [Mesorhizobium sp.]